MSGPVLGAEDMIGAVKIRTHSFLVLLRGLSGGCIEDLAGKVSMKWLTTTTTQSRQVTQPGGMWRVNSSSQARLAPEPVGESNPTMVPTMQPC